MVNTLWLIDGRDGHIFFRLSGGKELVEYLDYALDSGHLAIHGPLTADGRAWPTAAQVWDVRAAACRLAVRPDQGPGCARFTPGGDSVAVADGDRVQIWDIRRGRLTRTYRPPAGRAGPVAFAPDGKQLAVGCGEGPFSQGLIAIFSVGRRKALVLLRYSWMYESCSAIGTIRPGGWGQQVLERPPDAGQGHPRAPLFPRRGRAGGAASFSSSRNP
jgi:WD40 repeat protein